MKKIAIILCFLAFAPCSFAFPDYDVDAVTNTADGYTVSDKLVPTSTVTEKTQIGVEPQKTKSYKRKFRLGSDGQDTNKYWNLGGIRFGTGAFGNSSSTSRW